MVRATVLVYLDQAWEEEENACYEAGEYYSQNA